MDFIIVPSNFTKQNLGGTVYQQKDNQTGQIVEEIRRSIGADSLGYVSLEGLIEATEISENKLCSACFTGKYPIAIPADLSEGKSRLEITEVHGHN